MNPKGFLRYAGIVLMVVGVLGMSGALARISTLAFFHPPSWINWMHLVLGATVLCFSFTSYDRLQTWLVLFPAVIGTTMGLLGLIFGDFAAARYGVPDLADPSDHTAHLIVGVLAAWAWSKRKDRVRTKQTDASSKSS